MNKGQLVEAVQKKLGKDTTKAAADAARQQATASLIGGIGSIAGAALSGGMLPGGISSLFGGGK